MGARGAAQIAFGTRHSGAMAAAETTAFPFHQSPRHALSNRIADLLINARCDHKLRFALSVSLGALALLMQLPPIFLEWVTITEPKPVNQTNQKGLKMEGLFDFHVAYFSMCRSPADNLSALGLDEIKVHMEFPESCVLNPFFTSDDLSDFSFASTVILTRLALPGLLHVPGVFFCAAALLLSVAGEMEGSYKTLHSAVLYVAGGLFLFASLLQVISAVDDEMSPRMKPNAAGDASPFTYHYKVSFASASLSFLPLQICVYLETSAFFHRYPMPLERAGVVPGLRHMIDELICRSRRTLPAAPLSASSYRRDSRCSRDFAAPAFGAVQQEIPRLQPPLTENLHRNSIQMYI